MRCWPMVRAEGTGFRRPTVSLGLRPGQGGSVKALMQAAFGLRPAAVGAPQSGFDRRRLATPDGSANPTTPASAAGDTSLSLATPSVPSPSGSADAAVSHVPAAPTRLAARRRWSACADDGGRSEFPLGPPSFAPGWWPVKRASISLESLDGSSVALRFLRTATALTEARSGQ
jgi:hypothetical protein